MPRRSTERAFDTETRGLRWFREDQRAFLGTWADSEHEYVARLMPTHGRTNKGEFIKALKTADVLDAHNLKFDAHQVRETLGLDVFELKNVELHDTDLGSRIAMPEGQRKGERGGHGLKNLAKVFLREDAGEAEELIKRRYHEMTGRRSLDNDGAYYDVWRGFPEELEDYAVKDARYTYDLKPIIMAKLESDPKAMSLYNMERQVQRVLYHAEIRGTRVDPKAVRRLKKFYKGRDDAARKRLEETLGFVPEGSGSEERLEQALIDAGVPLTETTDKTGKLALNHQALEKFEDHPAVDALFEFRRVQKFLTTYITPMEGVEFVHPDFQQAEAWTGRMACRRPNMQNLPKRSDASLEDNLRIRSVLIPRPGYSFIIADFESVEMRILAYYLGVPSYRRLVGEGDAHAHTAAVASTLFPPVVIVGSRDEDFFKDTPNRDIRDGSKHVTFSITYGAGGPRVATTWNKMVAQGRPQLRIDEKQGRTLRNKIIAGIPGYKALADTSQAHPGRVVRQIREKGYVRTLMGRKQVVDPKKAYVGVNALIQGTAADVMKQAAINLESAMAPFGAYPLLFVHDEALIEVPTENAEAALPVAVEAMESAAILDPPLAVEAHITNKSYAHVH